MGKRTGPRHGSLAFYPRKRAKRIYPRVSTYLDSDEPKIQGFAAYKAGMTHVIAMEMDEATPGFRQNKALPVTVLECPALFVFGVRAYQKTPYGLKTFCDVLAEKPPKELARVINLPKKYNKEENIKKIESALTQMGEFRIMTQTQPSKIDLKKTPELVEFPVTGKDISKNWKFCLDLLGKEVNAKELFAEGEYVDVIGITTGKGTKGPVKRFGIKIQARKAKGHRRFPGNIGGWHPARVLYTVPMTGQVGFQKRTELGKRIVKIGENGAETTPKGGFIRYGEIKSAYMLINGSVPGPRKRLILLRKTIRPKRMGPMPELKSISLRPQQG